MKHKKFYDSDHAHRYLSGSVIRIGGEGAYINNVFTNRGKIKLSFYLIKDITKESTCSIEDEDVDLNPVPLGFVNYSAFNSLHLAVKAVRIPARDWKIGLTTRNLNIDVGAIPKRTILISTGMHKTIVNEYPSVAEAIDRVQKGGKQVSVAFSRKFSINQHSELIYIQLDTPVGEIYKQKEIMLYPNFEYLTQLLEKDLK